MPVHDLLASLVLGGAQTARTKSPGLADYDKAGPYTFGVDMGMSARASQESEIRGFLWEHWQRRRLGSLTATWISKEGAPNTYHYLIQPDENGVWCVSIHVERDLVQMGRSNQTHHEVEDYRAYTVERYEIPKGGNAPEVLIPGSGPRPPSSYELIFKDRHGKFVDGQ